MLRFTRNGLKDIAEDVIYLAKKEGLTGHAASVEQRANDNGPAARPKPKPEKVIAAAAAAAAAAAIAAGVAPPVVAATPSPIPVKK